MKIRLAIFFGAVLALSGHSATGGEEFRSISGLDFMVDWPNLVGTKVIIRGGRVALAGDDVAFLIVPGGQIYLSPPWADREDLRYLFGHCSQALTESDCNIDVAGIVERWADRDQAGLSPVDFLIPR